MIVGCIECKKVYGCYPDGAAKVECIMCFDRVDCSTSRSKHDPQKGQSTGICNDCFPKLMKKHEVDYEGGGLA